MTEREREARRLRLLLARLERDRESAFAVYERVGLAAGRARGSGPDPVATAAVALYLQNLLYGHRGDLPSCGARARRLASHRR